MFRVLLEEGFQLGRHLGVANEGVVSALERGQESRREWTESSWCDKGRGGLTEVFDRPCSSQKVEWKSMEGYGGVHWVGCESDISFRVSQLKERKPQLAFTTVQPLPYEIPSGQASYSRNL